MDRGLLDVKIGWGTPGDFDRCRVQLGRFVKPGRMLDGLCSNLHLRATGERPGLNAHGDKDGD
jgi:hypothetical protein